MSEKKSVPPIADTNTPTPKEPSRTRPIVAAPNPLLDFTIPPEMKAEINLDRILGLLAEGVVMPPFLRAKILDRLRRLDIVEEDVRRPPLRGYWDLRERSMEPVSELVFHGEILLRALEQRVPFSPNVRKELIDALRKGDE